MKYIIDIPSGLIIKDDGYSFSDGNSYCITGNLSKLTPYTNIDIKEKAEEFGRGYDAGWDEGSKFHEAEKESIEDNVWEFARKLISTSGNEVSEMWGRVTNFGEVMHNTTYQEAKAKYNEWLKQKDEIKVGDEIVGIYSDGEKSPPLVVLKVEGNYYYGIYSKTGEFVQGGLNYEKTGRHFDEVTELLEKMRGAE